MPTATRGKVLIVDDMATNIKILGMGIREEFDVLIATNGEKALEIARSTTRPDIILLDIIMPGIDGFEVCRQLKEDPETRDIPVIFITAKCDEHTERRGFEAGGVDYISKPFSVSVVRARVKTQWQLKRQRDDLACMAKKLEELNKTKNRFLGTAAHDLRNPLVSIRGMADIMREGIVGKVTDEQSEMLNTIHDAAHTMVSMVNDLLDVAVIESGKFDIKLELTDLTELIRNRIRLMKHIADQKSMKLDVQLHALPECMLDRDRIIQVFDNLYGNAIKFSPQGSTISLYLGTRDGQAMLEVRDEGPGIRKEDQSRLFGAFQKLGTKTTGGESSTGLGLSIVKRIVRAHQGYIEIESSEGSGTAMRVLLPIVTMAEEKKVALA